MEPFLSPSLSFSKGVLLYGPPFPFRIQRPEPLKPAPPLPSQEVDPYSPSWIQKMRSAALLLLSSPRSKRARPNPNPVPPAQTSFAPFFDQPREDGSNPPSFPPFLFVRCSRIMSLPPDLFFLPPPCKSLGICPPQGNSEGPNPPPPPKPPPPPPPPNPPPTGIVKRISSLPSIQSDELTFFFCSFSLSPTHFLDPFRYFLPQRSLLSTSSLFFFP